MDMELGAARRPAASCTAANIGDAAAAEMQAGGRGASAVPAAAYAGAALTAAAAGGTEAVGGQRLCGGAGVLRPHEVSKAQRASQQLPAGRPDHTLQGGMATPFQAAIITQGRSLCGLMQQTCQECTAEQ